MIFKFFFTDGIASSGSILEPPPLNNTALDISATLLPWVQTWIGVYNILPLTPEGWSEEGNEMKGAKKNGDVIWMPYHSKGRLTLQWNIFC